MRLAPIILAILALAGPAHAQSTAQQMLDMAAKLRANVERLKDNLPAETRAQMLQQAAEIERQVKDGAYGKLDAAPPPTVSAPDRNVAARLMAEHGRLDWLATKAACAGYTQENYSTFRFSPQINDRDSHCRNAYGHFARYLQVMRNGEGQEAADQALFYFDAAAKRAVGLVGE